MTTLDNETEICKCGKRIYQESGKKQKTICEKLIIKKINWLLATKKKIVWFGRMISRKRSKKKSPALDCVNFIKSHVLKLNYAREIKKKSQHLDISRMN